LRIGVSHHFLSRYARALGTCACRHLDQSRTREEAARIAALRESGDAMRRMMALYADWRKAVKHAAKGEMGEGSTGAQEEPVPTADELLNASTGGLSV
jgi:hypothetical protein